ncbi:MAG: methyltransferase domain-containing protein [Pseudomonadota bacterium]|nr:methyltransferase domain-containing protein [Pseudomonadota bacterium]
MPSPGEPQVDFRCNICGTSNSTALVALQRETPSCTKCGSTVRDRAMVHLLTSELLGSSVVLADLRPRLDLVGIGLSDSIAYALPMADKFAYINTHFDSEPRLDIASVPPEDAARYDFIIASDVFEHVAPPVARAFSNARRLLKQGGVLIFSVPFMMVGDTVEHFPDLHDYRLIDSAEGWRLENRTADGRDQSFTGLMFHGGVGSTLEMRQFTLAGLEREFAAAGFSRMRVAGEAFLVHGIFWPEPWSVPIVAHA